MLVKSLALAALAALLAVAAQSYEVNDLDNTIDYGFDSEDTRMVGGDIVPSTANYSFVVAIQPKYTDENSIVQKAPFCSGVLIQGFSGTTTTVAYYVLTSARCALSGTSYDLYAGTYKVVSSSTPTAADVLASTAIINDEFRQNMMTGDLAIIPVDATAFAPSTTAPVISTALLANITNESKSYLINTVTMAGWGYPNDVYRNHSPSLRQLRSWVVPNWYCAVRHISLPITKSHICTAGLPNKGPCTGDSGAPLIASSSLDATGRVIALATHTPRNGCSRGKPGVFTRVGDYLDWIASVTNYDVEA